MTAKSSPPKPPCWIVLGGDGLPALWTHDESLALEYLAEGYAVEGFLV